MYNWRIPVTEQNCDFSTINQLGAFCIRAVVERAPNHIASMKPLRHITPLPIGKAMKLMSWNYIGVLTARELSRGVIAKTQHQNVVLRKIWAQDDLTSYDEIRQNREE